MNRNNTKDMIVAIAQIKYYHKIKNNIIYNYKKNILRCLKATQFSFRQLINNS
jgi:hypothetical protein